MKRTPQNRLHYGIVQVVYYNTTDSVTKNSSSLNTLTSMIHVLTAKILLFTGV